ncbi:MAG: hypothetical protein Q9163_000565 [Psora crenata]
MDEDSRRKIAKHYEDEVTRIYNKAITELERVLKAKPLSTRRIAFLQRMIATTSRIPPTQPRPITPVKDSHEGELRRAAQFFCNNFASSIVTTPNIDIAQTAISGYVSGARGIIDLARLYTGADNEDDVYDISVKSVDGCIPDGGYNLGTPVADNQCPDILHSAWKQCEFDVLEMSFLCSSLADDGFYVSIEVVADQLSRVVLSTAFHPGIKNVQGLRTLNV